MLRSNPLGKIGFYCSVLFVFYVFFSFFFKARGLRQVVSQDRNRHKDAETGADMDLSYITSNIIGAGSFFLFFFGF